MCSKCEKWFISSMRWSFLIILVLLLFFSGIIFIYYAEISNGEKISSLFGFLSSLSIIVSIFLYFASSKNEKTKSEKLNKEHAIAMTRTISVIMQSLIAELNVILSRESMIEDNRNNTSLNIHSDMCIITIKNHNFETTTDVFIPKLELLNNCIIELSKINGELFNKAVNINILATTSINSTRFIFSKYSFETPTRGYFKLINQNINKIKLELSSMESISNNL